jgi:hypothetical protein
MGTPVIAQWITGTLPRCGQSTLREFKTNDKNLARLLRKAKLQRVLTGSISKDIIKEIESYFGGCRTCKWLVTREMYKKEFTACNKVGIKEHLHLSLIVKVASVRIGATCESIEWCSGYEPKTETENP